MRLSSKILTGFTFCMAIIAFDVASSPAQTKPETFSSTSTCSRDTALEIIHRQIEVELNVSGFV